MNSSTVRVAIVGVSGYSGMELCRLLGGHPRLRLELAVSDRWAGSTLGDKLPLPPAIAAVQVVTPDEGVKALATPGAVDLVFLCTPAEISLELAPRALDGGARVVDLSGAFRLSAEEYPRWYGFQHPRPDLLASAVYSMPEAGASGALASARLCANPGCYPTASVLAALPLVRAGIVDRAGLIFDAKSGTTGAGRKASEEMSFSEVEGDFRAYRVLRHQHTPEIERALALSGAGPGAVTFTAHLLPTRRGILSTVYGRLRPGKTAADAAAAVKAFAEGRPFLRAAKPDAVRLSSVNGTNRAVLGADADPERGVAIGFGAIDNLVKGAAGQAVQNANIMLGFEETAGLDGAAAGGSL
jgi:N-acetyl-gamma-glutamyl-phosphate reductase